LGWFETNYIIFLNVEIFKKKKSEIFTLKKIKESDGIFEKISFVEMESSKLIN
jgi:hypothetical protein